VDTQRTQYKKLQKTVTEQGKPFDVGVGVEVNDDRSSKQGDCGTIIGMEDSCSISPKSLAGRLTEDRIRRLQELGFVWSMRDGWQKVRVGSR
jgi:hypothetical protein